MAFRGHYEHSLDAKHRLSIPARFRADFASGLVLSKDSDQCIAVWTPDAHESIFALAISGKNPLGKEYKDVQRFFQSNSFDFDLDGSGRVTVPQPLLDHAGISKDVVVAGVGDHLEVWEKDAWAQAQARLDETIGEVAESLGDPS